MTAAVLIPDDLLAVATPAELDLYREYLDRELATWLPQEYQQPPSWDDHSWDIWALIGGRGIGKSDTGSGNLNEVLSANPGWRGRIIAPTLDDAREACILPPVGLLAHNRALKVNYNDHVVTWPNGSRARWFGMDKPDSPDRLRAGGNSHIDWFEELGAQTYAVQGWEQADFGRRLSGFRIEDHPRVFVTTTPRNVAIMRWLMGQATEADRQKYPSLRLPPRVVISTATTDDNKYLAPRVREGYVRRYGGTRLGQQELLGKLLTDVPGALWTLDVIETLRTEEPVAKRFEGGVWKEYVDLAHVVVGVDPATTSGENADDTGIIVAGKGGTDGHLYVIGDRSCHLSPDGWGRRAVQAYIDYQADLIVGEINNGGDMVESTIRTAAAAMGVPMPPYKPVHASRGKRVRAEPVSALYEQGRAHHCGLFAKLEDEMCHWLPDSGDSPDRMDAMVWAATELMLAEPEPAPFIGWMQWK